MVEYTLKTPIVLGEETIEVLKLEEPNTGKLLRFKVNLSEEFLTTAEGMKRLLLACATNIGEGHIKQMMLSDLTGAIGACTGFFE